MSTLTQHSGRGGRSGEPTIAILLVEASVYQVQKVKAGQSNEDDNDNDDDEGDDGDGEGIEEGNEKAGPSYRKKIDENLREYVEASECQCRRKIANEYFQNPSRTARKFIIIV
jgi:superfamily II DNA helicase RecQ